MRVFAISDHHFGHENIIKYCDRDAKDAAEDRELMIEAHNSVIEDDDLVVFVGDISASKQGSKWLAQIINRLKGRKLLVLGNHDYFKPEEYEAMGFEKVFQILKLNDYIFCHFPNHEGVIDLCRKFNAKLVCGHTHKVFPADNFGDEIERINVAVDVIGRKPILIFESESNL